MCSRDACLCVWFMCLYAVTEATINLTASAKDISLWWPVNSARGADGGARMQPLYHVHVSFVPDGAHSAGAAAVTATRRIGFRTVALVTGNDTDPEYVKKAAGEEGADSHGACSAWRVMLGGG
jgi:hypothetical protein